MTLRTLRSLTAQVFVLVLLMGVAACSSPTPYAEADKNRYGYSDQRIEENRYRVIFSGNRLTDRETVENYLLFRAAELTLASGHDYFEVVTKDTDTATTYYHTGPDVGIFGSNRGVGIGVGTTLGTTSPEQRFTAIADIIVRHGEKSEDNSRAYDAHAVVASLQPTIVYPEAS